MTGQPAPASLTEYAEGFCSALQAMTRAIGNPDTGADSDLSWTLEQAIERGDLAAVNDAAAPIGAELRAARHEAWRIAGWSEGTEAAKELDRFLAAAEAYVAALQNAAPQGMAAARTAAQRAFEGAGASDAWIGMLEEVNALASNPEAHRLIDCDIPPDPRNP